MTGRQDSHIGEDTELSFLQFKGKETFHQRTGWGGWVKYSPAGPGETRAGASLTPQSIPNKGEFESDHKLTLIRRGNASELSSSDLTNLNIVALRI